MTNAASKLIKGTASTLNVTETALSRGVWGSLCILYFYKIIYPKLNALYKNDKLKAEQEKKELAASYGKRGPELNKDFLKQFMKLFKVIVPGVWSKSSLILSLHTITLVARTFLSIYVAHLEGKIVKNIVRKDVAKFSLRITQWISVAIPATFVNSMIRFLESHLALCFRSRLVSYSYDLYFKKECYYRVSNLDGRIENPDHCLTDDISAFCSSVAHLYSHITKPLLDCIMITYSIAQLGRSRGGASLPGKID